MPTPLLALHRRCSRLHRLRRSHSVCCATWQTTDRKLGRHRPRRLIWPIGRYLQLRFVLAWGRNPVDLDIRLATPTGCQVAYFNKQCADGQQVGRAALARPGLVGPLSPDIWEYSVRVCCAAVSGRSVVTVN